MKKLKIITYNVLDGFENADDRKAGVVAFLKNEKPDVVFLNELNHFDEFKLKDFANGYNHSYVILLSGRSDYKIAITANTPFTNTELHYQNLLGHGFIYTNTNNITLLSTHLNPHSIQKRLHDIEIIIKKLEPEINNKAVLFGGDLNSLFYGEKNEYNDEVNHLRKWYLYRSEKTPNYNNLVNNELDFSITKRIANANMQDLLSQQNRPFHKSYPTSLEKDFRYDDPIFKLKEIEVKKIKARIDYLWASPNLAKQCSNCYIAVNENLDKLSDHFPLIAEFS